MKRKYALTLISSLLLLVLISFQNCGQSVNFKSTSNPSNQNSTSTGDLNDFAKLTQSISLSVFGGFRACFPSPCAALPKLEMNLNTTRNFSLDFEFYENPETAPLLKRCLIVGTLNNDDVAFLRNGLNTISTTVVSTPTCEQGEICGIIADAPSMAHKFNINGTDQFIYTTGFDANLTGDITYYSPKPTSFYCNLKSFFQAKNSSACPSEQIDKKLKELLTLPINENVTCN